MISGLPHFCFGAQRSYFRDKILSPLLFFRFILQLSLINQNNGICFLKNIYAQEGRRYCYIDWHLSIILTFLLFSISFLQLEKNIFSSWFECFFFPCEEGHKKIFFPCSWYIIKEYKQSFFKYISTNLREIVLAVDEIQNKFNYKSA